jgi:two-component system, cell cycle response regulator
MKFISKEFLLKKTLTAKQVIFRIFCIELTFELIIMLVFRMIPHQQGTLAEAILDPILLVSFSTPAIYFFVIRPFVEARDEAIVHINHLAHTDPLTKLANRRLILDYLEILVDGNTRNPDHGAVLLIDLDGFKPINDNYGHDAGDALLIKVGERLRACVRAEDVVGRLGGDEFIILLRRLGADDKIARYVAQFVAYKLIKQVMEPVEHNGNILLVGASVGIRLFGAETDVHKIVSDADAAMYQAKAAGKGCAVFYDDEEKESLS